MTDNAGIDPRVAAAEESAREVTDAPDQTQVAEDPTGEARDAVEPPAERFS